MIEQRKETVVDLSVLLPKLEARLREGKFQDHTSIALCSLLREYQKQIKELSPVYFHTAFRQIDVTGRGNVDNAIWHLLRESKTFWEVFTDEYLKSDA